MAMIPIEIDRQIYTRQEVKRMILDILEGGPSHLDNVLCSRCDLHGTNQCPPVLSPRGKCKYDRLTREELVDWYLRRGGPQIKK